MYKENQNSHPKLIAIISTIFVILVAFLGFKSFLLLPIMQSFLFITHPSPPEYIIKVFPAPGEIVHEETFNNQDTSYGLSYGYVCFYGYTSELSGEFGEYKRIDRNFQLTINDKDTIGFWKGERNWVGRIVTQEEDLQGTILAVCWDVNLSPGDYLAKLKYGDNDIISVFNWAFRVIDE